VAASPRLHRRINDHPLYLWAAILIPILVLAGFASLALAQRPIEPEFKDFSADVYAGKAERFNLKSHSLARTFRTVIREQLTEEGINFAGHYTLVVAGCGTGCSISGIVDAQTGNAYFPKELEGWTSIVGEYDWREGEDVRTFRADSRLLRAVGRPSISSKGEKFGPSGVYFYEWTNNRLKLVKFIPAGSYPRTDNQ